MFVAETKQWIDTRLSQGVKLFLFSLPKGSGYKRKKGFWNWVFSRIEAEGWGQIAERELQALGLQTEVTWVGACSSSYDAPAEPTLIAWFGDRPDYMFDLSTYQLTGACVVAGPLN
jgi:hypothetical protein